MAESEEQVQQNVPEHQDDEDETEGKYKTPAQKSIKDIIAADAEDESLRRYKETLLKGAGGGEEYWPGKGNVILRKMSVQVEGRPDLEIDLDKTDESQLKKMKFVVKEGAKYRLMLTFNVQREIVSGFRFINKITRKGLPVDKNNNMLGSYAPSKDCHEWRSPEDEFPTGMLSRGSYTVKSLFTDDDKNDILKWEWGFDIKKDWE